MQLDTYLDFQCNCCGTFQHTPWSKMTRENASCFECGSSVRMRGVAHHIGMALFGRPLTLPDFPLKRDVRGIGMSDWEGYATTFERVFDYQNTYYHKDPIFDVTKELAESHTGKFDFVICTEVFEHILPPVETAFVNMFSMMRPGGFLVFTVPYTMSAQTKEHFPDCVRGELLEIDGSWVYAYRDSRGKLNFSTDLVFHGGPGTTLEMREFSLPEVVHYLEAAGFCNVRVQNSDYLPFGIVHESQFGYPITAWKPTAAPPAAP